MSDISIKNKENIDKCYLLPSEGGLSIGELRKLAKEMGINVENRERHEICILIEEILQPLFSLSNKRSPATDKYGFEHEYKYKYLSGSNSFIKLRDAQGHVIYLLGESHDNIGLCFKGDCITTDNFIIDMIKSTDQLVDVYIEAPYHKGDLQTVEDYHKISPLTNAIYYTFRDCLNENKATCPYSNARFHYSDIREGGLFSLIYRKTIQASRALQAGESVEFLRLGKKPLEFLKRFDENFVYDLLDFVDKLHKGWETSSLMRFGNLIATRKIKVNVDNEADEKLSLIPNPERISKGLKKLPKSTRSNLKSLLDTEYLKEFVEQFNRIGWDNIIEQLENPSDPMLLRDISIMFKIINNLLMDVYLLSRLLHQMDDSNLKFIYGGIRHVTYYYEFLTKYMNFVEIFTLVNRDEKCLDLTEKFR